MQTSSFAGGGVLRQCRSGCPRPLSCRSPNLLVHAKLKYKANIAQNHKRKLSQVSIDLNKLYTDPAYVPSHQVGPIRIAQLPGRGRGLVAADDLGPGDTALALQPLAGPGTGSVTGPEGRPLRPEHLAHALGQAQAGGRLGSADRARLRLLHGSAAAPEALRGAPLDAFSPGWLEEKLRRAGEAPKRAKGKGFGAAPAAAAAPAAPTAADLAALGADPLGEEELARLCELNAWGEDAGDAGAAGTRGEPQAWATIGIWPEFSLLNHSCAPNTVAFAAGSTLLVQVTREVPAGAELTTCYLADLVHAPLAVRRAYLQAAYGFTCECARCKAEEALPAAVQEAVAAIHAATDTAALEEQATAAIRRSDSTALEPLAAALAADVERLEALMAQHELEEQVRSYLRSCVYPAHYWRAFLHDLPAGAPAGPFSLFGGGGGGRGAFSDVEAPARLAEITGAVAPGSDQHLYLRLDAFVRTAEAHGRDDPRVAAATKDCLRAFILRYGAVSDAVLPRLISARGRRQHHLGVAVLPGQPAGGAAAALLGGGQPPAGPSASQLAAAAAAESGAA